jgi:hypothetical protein
MFLRSAAAMAFRSVTFLVLVAAGVQFSPVFADTTVYRCTKEGQLVFTDKPCDGKQSTPSSTTPPLPSSPAPAPAPTPSPSFAGAWQGQAQFHGRENGEILTDAHTVVPLNLELSADGKISGASPENGCKLLGLWTPGDPARIVWLDVTLNGCRYAGLNRRYSGSFMLSKPESSGQLSLQSSELPHGAQGARQYDVKSTLRR